MIKLKLYDNIRERYKGTAVPKKLLCAAVCAVLFAALILILLLPMCAKEPAVKQSSIIFECAYDRADKTLTVTASVRNPDIRVNTAMFMLDYDNSLLETNAGNVSFLGAAQRSAVYESDGHIGTDWFYNEGLAESEGKTPAVSIVFNVEDGAEENSLKNSLGVCSHSDVLNEAGGYGIDGGLLLCESSNVFENAAQGKVSAVFDYGDTEKNKVSAVPYTIAVLLTAAVLGTLTYRKTRNKRKNPDILITQKDKYK